MGQPTSEAADIYSFGVLLWELSVREAPAGRHLRRVEVPEEAPAAVVELMDRCLAADPAARPTALELVHFFVDLGRAGSGSGATAADGAGDGVPLSPTTAAPPPLQRRDSLVKRLSGRLSGSGKGDRRAASQTPPPPAVVPPSGFGGAPAAAAAVPAVAMPASGFAGGGGVAGVGAPPRPVGRPGVSGPPGRAGEP